MVRKSWRIGYAELQVRLHESGLPYDERAERAAIGALLLAPQEHAVKLARRAYKDHFYDRGRGWLWERLSWSVRHDKADFNQAGFVVWWLVNGEIVERFGEYFMGSAIRELTQCSRECFWWHGHYYVDRVIAAAKVRARIQRAVEELGEALDHADEWRVK
jgi:hypothetical protein